MNHLLASITAGVRLHLEFCEAHVVQSFMDYFEFLIFSCQEQSWFISRKNVNKICIVLSSFSSTLPSKTHFNLLLFYCIHSSIFWGVAVPRRGGASTHLCGMCFEICFWFVNSNNIWCLRRTKADRHTNRHNENYNLILKVFLFCCFCCLLSITDVCWTCITKRARMPKYLLFYLFFEIWNVSFLSKEEQKQKTDHHHRAPPWPEMQPSHYG